MNSSGNFFRLPYQHAIGDFYTYTIESGFRGIAQADIKQRIIVSPDYRRIAYLDRSSGGITITIDGVTQKPYAWINDRSVVFSPDGKRYAYVGFLTSGDAVAVIDGREYGPYPHLFDLSLGFSLDNAHVRYACATKKPSTALAVSTLVLSGGRGQLSYMPGTDTFVIIDGSARKDIDPRTIPLHEEGEYSWPRSRGKHAPMQKGEQIVSEDGKWTFTAYQIQDGPITVQTGKADGAAANGLLYDEIIGAIVIDSPNTFHYLARKDNRYCLIEECLVESDCRITEGFESIISKAIATLGSNYNRESATRIFLGHSSRERDVRAVLLLFKDHWFYSTNIVEDIETLSMNSNVLLVTDRCPLRSEEEKMEDFGSKILPGLFTKCRTARIPVVWSNAGALLEGKSELGNYLAAKKLPLKGAFLFRQRGITKHAEFRKWFNTSSAQVDVIARLL